ncbi:hypothetical protein HPP92_024676 [Vanilla planifolia]|uniref:Uncharacterized protein n=1 Tax=Vanilla planifolia TaxID=51239 RepID=A0A835PNH8_VANPL|nr:hypothetical protein HPP92_024676 [Vanilla planifolia]
MASSTEGLVPITRDFLAKYYDKYPVPAISEDVARLTSELRSLSDELLKDSPLTFGEQMVAEKADCDPPHKVDENLWNNREHIEEILYLLGNSRWQAILDDFDITKYMVNLQVPLQNTLKALEKFQSKMLTLYLVQA